MSQPVFDGHNDALTQAGHAGLATGRPEGHLDLPRMREAGMRGGIFAVFTPAPGDEPRRVPRDDGVAEYAVTPVGHDLAAAHATAAAGRLLGLEREGAVRVARSIADVDTAFTGEGPPVAVLHLEGAEAIDPGGESLALWHAAGLRSLGPVWSRPNAFGHGVPFAFPSSPDTGPGLTPQGIALVRRCSEMGVLVDLSHLNAAGFWDVARLDAGPLVVSHAGAHALCPASRNLTDAQIDAVGASGGLVGIIFACSLLRADFGDDPTTPVALIARHARHVADRIGPEHVALGSDFDGALIPDAVGDVRGLPLVLEALAAEGFGPEDIAAVAWGNWRRVLAAWWGA
ncbi:MAG: dipeptidase [Thermoleophilia bacterium]|nr:dipeptidase [Thermoleophilia bacterium]